MKHLRVAKHCSAFTLTELLVVITIIAILAGLITSAAINALRTAKQARIALEIRQLQVAIENFNNQYGAYPPNLIVNTLFSAPGVERVEVQDVRRMFKKMFPRNREPESIVRALTAIPAPSTLADGMTASESLFFWLGGFSKDQTYPISGPGGPSFTDADGNDDGVLDGSDERIENRSFLFDGITAFNAGV